MKYMVLIIALVMTGFNCPCSYADPILEGATQLIPQGPEHPVTVLNELKPVTSAQVKQDFQPKIIAKSAGGETQHTVMDQNGRWKVLQNTAQ